MIHIPLDMAYSNHHMETSIQFVHTRSSPDNKLPDCHEYSFRQGLRRSYHRLNKIR